MRYKTVDAIELTRRNTSGEAVSDATVRVETAYLNGFSSVSFTPDAATVTARAYIVELGEMPAGESRTVSIDLQAEHYGSYDGTIEASADGSSASLRSGTFNFP